MTRKIGNSAWDKGYDAYHEQISRTENPYPEESEEFEDWEDGWDTADSDSDDE